MVSLLFMEPEITNLTQEDKWLLSRKKELLADNKNANSFLDFLEKQIPEAILKNLEDNIDLFRVMDRRITDKLTVGKVPPTEYKVRSYMELLCKVALMEAQKK